MIDLTPPATLVPYRSLESMLMPLFKHEQHKASGSVLSLMGLFDHMTGVVETEGYFFWVDDQHHIFHLYVDQGQMDEEEVLLMLMHNLVIHTEVPDTDDVFLLAEWVESLAKRSMEMKKQYYSFVRLNPLYTRS